VVSTIKSSPPMVSDELRRQADNFVELMELAPHIQRMNAPNRTQTAPAEGDDGAAEETVQQAGAYARSA
jgi:hypothetical protein